MSIIIFILILGLLIFVHELGHFLVAKATGMRVDSFAIGFSPNLLKWKRGETTYKLNLIPFGGYVKIHGEAYAESGEMLDDQHRSFGAKKWWQQSLVLVAGVFANMVLAWLMIVVAFMIGFPALAGQDLPKGATLSDERLMILEVAPDSPADMAGLRAGDSITALWSASGQEIVDPTSEDVQATVAASSEVLFAIERGEEVLDIAVTPTVADGAENRTVGIAMNYVGTLQLSAGQAVVQGTQQTVAMTGAVATGLGQLIGDAFQGDAELDTLSGPVGIVGLVGDAQTRGIVSLLTLIAVISINLAVLNLIPFPALDGGRLLFVLGEAITKRKTPPKVFNAVNAIGFFILIALMIVVTVNDVIRLF